MKNRAWNAAALLLCGLGACAGAYAQIRVGTTDGGTSINRGVINKKASPAEQLRASKQACLAYIAKAQAYFDQGKHGQACLQLNKAKKLLVARELADKCIALALKIDDAGYRQIKLGDAALKRKDYREAIRIYLVVSRTYLELPASRAARDKLAQLEKNPQVAAALAEEKAAAMFGTIQETLGRHRERAAAKAAAATTLPAEAAVTTRPAASPANPEAIGGLDDDDLLDVAELLEKIVRRYPDTPTGRKAAALLAALETDTACKGRLARLRAQRQARQDLAKANLYCDAGLLAKAAQMYRQVIKDHPRSPQAHEAARQLGIIEAKLSAR